MITLAEAARITIEAPGRRSVLVARGDLGHYLLHAVVRAQISMRAAYDILKNDKSGGTGI